MSDFLALQELTAAELNDHFDLAPTRIDLQVLGSAAASVSFSSIPGTYSSLQLHIVARSSTSATNTTGRVRFNGDSGANYDSQQMAANAAVVAAFEAINATGADIGEFSAATATSGAPSIMNVVIPFYAGTTFWKQLTSSHALSTTTGTTGIHSKHWASRWRDTSAITSITVFPAAGNFITGSSFALYGWP